MRAIVLGGAGFIGSYLVPKLQEKFEVVIFDKKAQPPGQSFHSYIQGNICDKGALEHACRGADLIYNLAAEHHDNVRPVSRYAEVNVEGSRNVCEAASRNGIRRIVFTSSVAIYGAQEVAMREDAAHDYFNEYGRTKHLAEIEYEKWLQSDPESQITIVRPTVVFGPGNRGNVYNFLYQLKFGPFLMLGAGHNVKSMAHVENIATFLAFLADRPERHGVYNYADKPDFSVRDLVRFVDVTLGRADRYRPYLPAMLGIAGGHLADIVSSLSSKQLPVSAVRVRKFCASSEINAERAMNSGFTPPQSLKEGLREMVMKHI